MSRNGVHIPMNAAAVYLLALAPHRRGLTVGAEKRNAEEMDGFAAAIVARYVHSRERRILRVSQSLRVVLSEDRCGILGWLLEGLLSFRDRFVIWFYSVNIIFSIS